MVAGDAEGSRKGKRERREGQGERQLYSHEARRIRPRTMSEGGTNGEVAAEVLKRAQRESNKGSESQASQRRSRSRGMAGNRAGEAREKAEMRENLE
jgi:hypothetical protein